MNNFFNIYLVLNYYCNFKNLPIIIIIMTRANEFKGNVAFKIMGNLHNCVLYCFERMFRISLYSLIFSFLSSLRASDTRFLVDFYQIK